MPGDHPSASVALCFSLRDEIAIEDFKDGSLVLLCDALELRRVNAASRRLLALLDGNRTVQDVAAVLPVEYGATPASVAEALLEMERQRIVRRAVKLTTKRNEHMQHKRYLANPDVSFRQEDDDGGILFNADTDALEVINPTAVEIWKALASLRTNDEVAMRLCEVCDDAPREQVEKDVAEFLESMVEKGFVGIVEEES